MRASRGPLSGRFRLGVIPTVAPYLLPKMIRALSDSFPEIELDKIEKPRGMNISLITSAHTDKEGKMLLKLLGMPFKK